MALSRTHIINCVKCAQFIKDPILRTGVVSRKEDGGVLSWGGGFSTVVQILINGEYWAFKVWHSEFENMQIRYSRIKDKLSGLELPYFVKFDYEAKGLFDGENFFASKRMKWIDGIPLNEYINKYIFDSERINMLAKRFRIMMKALHIYEIAHGDLQHGNIFIRSDGSLKLIDYDSMFVNTLLGMPDFINGQAGYQHPKRIENEFVGDYLDNFSEILIYFSLLVYSEKPELWNPDTDWLLFSKEDLEFPESCTLLEQFKSSDNSLIRYIALHFSNILNFDDISLIPTLEDLLSSNVEITLPNLKNITDKF